MAPNKKEVKYSTAVRVMALTHFCGVAPRLFEVLLRRFGTLEGIYAAKMDAFLAIDGLTEDSARRLAQVSDQLEATLALAKQYDDRDINLLTRFDATFSSLLFELSEPPSLLYVRGRAPDHHKKSVAVVGAADASSEGITLTSGLVKALVQQGVQIISSLAGGIDMTAHLAANSAKGAAFAVLDRGIDTVDQQTGIPVAIDLVQSGGVLSEYAPPVEPNEMFIAESNRVIAGLAQAVVITEMYANSERVLDLLKQCRDIGKLTFLLADSEHGALSDKTSLAVAAECGAIPIVGLNKVDDIIRSLV